MEDLPRCPWCEEALGPGQDVVWKHRRDGESYAYHEECYNEKIGDV